MIIPKANPIRSDISASAVRKSAEDVCDPTKRRFLAVAAVLDGMMLKDAAKMVDVMPHTLRKWIRWFNEAGLDGLRRDQTGQREPSDIGIERNISADELRRAAKGLDQLFAKRLLVIADVLDGMGRKAAAAKNNCITGSIHIWISRLNAEGIEGLLTDRRGRGRAEPIRSDISAEDLRRAAKDVHARERTRLLVVADVISGMSQEDVAKKVKKDPSTISRWIKRFNKDGLDSLKG